MSEEFLLPHPMEEEYLAIARFVEEHDGINYLQLDNYTVEKVNLFAIPEQKRFFALEQRLDQIIAALPAFKRIFTKPITRLKDVEAVLPVESVRVIDHSTMRHVSLHTEFWGNVTEETFTPRKLLTVTHEEEYKIYENVAFAQLINIILDYVKVNIRLCKNVIYSSRPMNFDLMERTNHLMYFLALGKLHVGYAHAQDRYHYIHGRCLEKLLFIDKTLRAKLNAPVYRICKKDQGKLVLKRTNVFRLQKDYRQVYTLLKLFQEEKNHPEFCYDGAIAAPNAYADYCTLLSLFSAKHYNFNFDEQEQFHFRSLKTSCRFKDWNLKIERIKDGSVEALRFQVDKDQSYSVCLIFWEGEEEDGTLFRNFARKHPSDEFLIAQHAVRGVQGSIYLNIFDIDSFRRIQQLLLRGMIYADSKRELCPFCGAPLNKTPSGAECVWCKTLIERRVCHEKNHIYYTVSLKDYHPPYKFKQSTDREGVEDPVLKERQEEAMLFYRNITAVNKIGEPVCPHCGKIH